MEKTSEARADLDPRMPSMVERAGAAEDTIPILVDPNDPSKHRRSWTGEQNSAPWWSLYVDGASNGDGAGAGIELISPEAHKIRHATHLAFHATNNDAEYEALINGLKLALEMKVENLNVFSDSMIVVYQINGGYQAKGPRTELYLKCAQRIIARFNEVRLELIPRGQNEGADELAKLGSRRESTLLGTVPLDIQRQPSVPEHEVGSLIMSSAPRG
ncbi:uncharacterized protein LOC141704256 [Apium graveolens]|uniref:uncharacterized protein LOC141686269 n=1 Tax=Apium graveolens TaxID=4045 RepID=UPI003D7BCB23